MSEADKMFEELGYEKWEHTNYIFYEKPLVENAEYEKDYAVIEFNYETKTINKTLGDDNTICDIDMQELRVIKKKCEELKWL